MCPQTIDKILPCVLYKIILGSLKELCINLPSIGLVKFVIVEPKINIKYIVQSTIASIIFKYRMMDFFQFI